MPFLETNRLLLIPFTIDYVEAAMKGREALKAVSGYDVSEQWPNEDYAEILPWVAEQLKENPERSRWSGLIIHKEDHIVIGELGGKGGPDENGVIEIGYGIVPDYQGSGYASEIVRAFVDWLNQCPEITKVVAECAEDNIASKRVLEKTGFQLVKRRNGMLYWESVN
jgi:ribosomal-protein-alanine N-acetyltransferase